MKHNIQTSQKTKEPVIPELKPSMARAPRMTRKVVVTKRIGARAGVDYEVYNPAIHNK